MSTDRTIAPEVRQRRLSAIRRAIELGHVGGNEDTEWLLEDVERLEAHLRAVEAAHQQEMEQLKVDLRWALAYVRHSVRSMHRSKHDPMETCTAVECVRLREVEKRLAEAAEARRPALDAAPTRVEG